MSTAAVPLPKRLATATASDINVDLENGNGAATTTTKAASPMVWIIKDESATEQCEKDGAAAGLGSGSGAVVREICCKELKGADDRSLIDPEILKLIVIGFMDGICVPLALTAGLSVLGSTHLVVIGGLAELVSGALSMSIGGFLGAQADRDQFLYYTRTTQERVERSCIGEMEREVHEILKECGVDKRVSALVTASLYKAARDQSLPQQQRKAATFFDRRFMTEKVSAGSVGLTPFLVQFGEGMEEITRLRTIWSGALVGLGYLIGGLIPLMPYFIIKDDVLRALFWSIGVTAFTLLLFGSVQAYYSGAGKKMTGILYGALSTLAIGGAAAAASYGVVSALER